MTGALFGAWLGAEKLSIELRDWWTQIERMEELTSLADDLLDAALDVVESQPPDPNAW